MKNNEENLNIKDIVCNYKKILTIQTRLVIIVYKLILTDDEESSAYGFSAS